MHISGINNGTFGLGMVGAVFPANMGGPLGSVGYPLPVDLAFPTRGYGYGRSGRSSRRSRRSGRSAGSGRIKTKLKSNRSHKHRCAGIKSNGKKCKHTTSTVYCGHHRN